MEILRLNLTEALAHTRQDNFNIYVNAWQSMTNSAFQGGEQILSTIWALAIHLLKCMAEAQIVLNICSPLWKAELVIFIKV